MRTLVAAAVCAAGLAACAQSDVEVTNPNSPLASGAASDPTALQLLATGLQVDQRGTRAAIITNTGILGREMYTFTPQEGRNTTHYLIGITVAGKQELDPAGFATGSWGGEFGAIRDIFNFKNTIAASSRTAAEKAAALGFAETFEGMMQFEILQTRDSLGTITEVKANPFDLAPFVSRDSGYMYALNILDDAAAKLAAGGAAFPFSLGPGFGAAVAGANFNTPATFLQFNRAYKAKVSAYYATAGGGSAAWQAALTALGQSFLNAGATTRAAFDVGPNDTYAPSPDSPNGLTQATNTNLYAHMSIQADAQLQAGGAPDARYTAKIRTGLPSRQGPISGGQPTSAASTLGYSIWPTTSSPIPIIRNEELFLLRAEAKLGTGDKAGAIADLNIVRTNSGLLPALTLTAASPDSAVVTAILYEKRYSLMMEGDRWSDMRRYGRLSSLPLDVPSGPNANFIAKVMPVPQGECLNRVTSTNNMRGPAGLDDCAP
jgi:hypothetical protein